MKVRQLLSSKGREVVTAGAGDTVESAIRAMQARNISALIVEEAGRPVGIFTERDVLRAYLATGGRSFAQVALREAMTVNLVVAELDDAGRAQPGPGRLHRDDLTVANSDRA
jgi:CBS domain-containing protein